MDTRGSRQEDSPAGWRIAPSSQHLRDPRFRDATEGDPAELENCWPSETQKGSLALRGGSRIYARYSKSVRYMYFATLRRPERKAILHIRRRTRGGEVVLTEQSTASMRILLRLQQQQCTNYVHVKYLRTVLNRICAQYTPRQLFHPLRRGTPRVFVQDTRPARSTEYRPPDADRSGPSGHPRTTETNPEGKRRSVPSSTESC